jgi:hypothetical protein
MPSTALTDIALIFPNASAEEKEFCSHLERLFADTSHTATNIPIQWIPSAPQGALPATSLRFANVECPQIVFTPLCDIDLCIGGVRLLGTNTGPASAKIIATPEANAGQISIIDLAERLSSHITRIDHTGVNLPQTALTQEYWQKLQHQIAKQSALYAYPEQEWPFIIPSTAAERTDDIRDFVIGREPKFELVYDEWNQTPIIQFALGTDLTQAELRELVPEVWLIPGLGDIFCSVNVQHPWSQLSIRLDMYYKSPNQANDWDTGQWLITEGGRIRA